MISIIEILIIICIILCLPFFVILSFLFIGSPNNIIHKKNKKENKL